MVWKELVPPKICEATPFRAKWVSFLAPTVIQRRAAHVWFGSRSGKPNEAKADSRTGSRKRDVFFPEFGVFFLEELPRVLQEAAQRGTQFYFFVAVLRALFYVRVGSWQNGFFADFCRGAGPIYAAKRAFLNFSCFRDLRCFMKGDPHANHI